MSKTSIEWTDARWNPVRGCTRVSEGCRNCFAERMAGRFSDEGQAFHGFAVRRNRKGKRTAQETLDVITQGFEIEHRWTGRVELVPEKLDEPLHWRKPRMVFVNSMSDLFHEALPEKDIIRVFSVMQRARQHTFQVLTKRPERMAEVVRRIMAPEPPLPNVWLGVSVEDQKTADERIPLLLQTPAVLRFVSYEPALEPLDFRQIKLSSGCPFDALQGGEVGSSNPAACGRWPGLDWVIVGGESGPGARPLDVAWARSVIGQCREAGVPPFVKQLGARPIEAAAGLNLRKCWTGAEGPRGEHREPIRHPKGGDPAEWSEDLRVREMPT